MTDKKIKEVIDRVYGNKLRVRVCGICQKEDRLLLIKHLSKSKTGVLWAPPGGGLEFGESISHALKREFLEEVGSKIEVNKFLVLNEFLKTPLHAIELFFSVNVLNQNLTLGTDPEMEKGEQIIKELRWISFEELEKMNPDSLHPILHKKKWKSWKG